MPKAKKISNAYLRYKPPVIEEISQFDIIYIPQKRVRKPVPYTSPTGKKTYLFPISTLADNIGLSIKTVRLWEMKGIIPRTPFKVTGARMYSTEHIYYLTELLYIFGDRSTRNNWWVVPLSNRTTALFKEINDYFFMKGYEDVKEKGK